MNNNNKNDGILLLLMGSFILGVMTKGLFNNLTFYRIFLIVVSILHIILGVLLINEGIDEDE